MTATNDSAARFGTAFGSPADGTLLGELYALSDVVTPAAVRVIATLRVADRLEGGIRRSAGELATASGVDTDALRRVLRHLVTRGVLAEPSTDVFSTTPLGEPRIPMSNRCA